MIRIVSAVACASLALLHPTAAFAEDTKPIWADMEKATTVFESKGYEATAWEKQGEAAQGDHVDLTVRLDAAPAMRCSRCAARPAPISTSSC